MLNTNDPSQVGLDALVGALGQGQQSLGTFAPPGAAPAQGQGGSLHAPPGLTPQQISQLQALQAGLSSGLDPSFVASQVQSIEAAHQSQVQAFHQHHAQMRQNLQAMGPQMEQNVVSQWQAGVPQGAVQAAYGNYGSGVQNSLNDIVSATYGSGQAPGTAPAGAAPLDSTSIQGVAQDATNFAKGYQDAAGIHPPISLHQARLQIMTVLRAQGYTEADLNRAYDLIGQMYQVNGGQIDAPVTSIQRDSAVPPAIPSAAPAPTPSPAPSGPNSFGVWG